MGITCPKSIATILHWPAGSSRRRPLLHQAFHGLYRRGLQVSRSRRTSRRLPVRHPALHQANVGAADRRQHHHSITAALARNPDPGRHGGSADDHQRRSSRRSPSTSRWSTPKTASAVNAVAPGAVYTPLHRNTPKDVMESLSPMGRPSTVRDITDAVIYLADAATVTGHILYVGWRRSFRPLVIPIF